MNTWKKELAILQKSKFRAQEKGDLKEESKVCNAIGELYFQNGEFKRAYKEHITELALAESSKDHIGAAIAQRKIGECLCELKRYEEALEHQKMHLAMAKKANDLTEEQRALNNIGRTYFIWSDDLEGDHKLNRLSDAQKAYLECLEVCDRLDGVVDEHEVMDMRARAYLNIGLTYESREMNVQALQFVKKAFIIAREQKDLQTMQKCHVSIGDIHISSNCPASALQAYEEALRVAKKCKNKLQEVTALESMGKAFVHLEDFRGAKQSYRTAYKLCVHQDVKRSLAKSYLKVRRIVALLYQVDDPTTDMAAKRESCDKLGDIFTGLNLPRLALKYYLKDLELADALALDKKTRSNIIASVAMTYEDMNDYHSAIEYFERDLSLWQHAPAEEYTSYLALARNKTKAGYSYEDISELYQKALVVARQLNSHNVVSVCKHIVKLSRLGGRLDEAAKAEEELQQVLSVDPVAEQSSDSEDGVEHGNSESTQDGDLDLTPSESSSEDEERQIPMRIDGSHSTLRVARRRQRSKFTKKNEKGETLLHLAAIQGNYKVAEQLIKQGMNVNEKDNFGWTPLHEACNWGHAGVVELLLNHGALVNHSGRTGSNALTPLHDSCWNMHEDVVKVLLDRGADPMAKNRNGQTPLLQVTEMLKLTKETLANSGDRRKQAEIAEKSENARCLENIATMLMARMPRKEVELDLNNTTVSVDRDCRIAKMKDGASAFQSSSYLSPHSSTQRELNERFRDRSGRNMLLDEEDKCTSSVFGLSRSNSFEPKAPLDWHSSPIPSGSSDQTAPGLYHMPGDRDDDPLQDDWLVNDDDVGEPARKRRRENCQPSQAPSTAQNSKPHSRTPSSAPRIARQRGLFEGDRRASAIDTSATSDSGDVHIIDDCSDVGSCGFQDSTRSSDPPFSQNSRSKSPTQGQPVVSRSMRIRVTIKQKTLLIPCPLSEESPLSISWLACQASQRYLNQYGERPSLSLTTRDGAQLFMDDRISDVLTQNEEVIGLVESWDLPSPVEQYRMHCKQVGKSPHPKLLRILELESVVSRIGLPGYNVPEDSMLPLLKCAQNWTSLLELNLEGNKLGNGTLRLVASALCTLPQLKLLNLNCCAITCGGIDVLSSTLVSQRSNSDEGTNLEVLKMSYNPLRKGEVGLINMLRSTSSLKCVHVEHCDLDLTTLFSLNNESTVFQHLDAMKLGGNSLNDVAALFKVLSTTISAGIQELDMSNTQYTSYSLCSLSVLQPPTTPALTSLILSDCSLTDANFITLCSYLVNFSSNMKECDFSLNRITSRSVPSIKSVIQASPRLVTLDVSGNDQLGTGCMEILIAVLEMGSIQRLLMSACGMTVPNQQHTVAMEGLIEKLQASCCVLHHLDISDSSLSNPQVEILRSLLNPFTKSLVM